MATNPFTSAQAGPSFMGGQALTNPEIIALDRQRKMAEMLLKKGMEGQPEGQNVSGYYVPPSFAQRLSPVLNRYLGEKGLKEVDEKTARLAEMLREKEAVALADYMRESQGRPAVPDRVTEMAGPYSDNVPMPTATMPGTPAVAGNRQMAFMNVLQNPNAPSWLKQEAIKRMTADPEGYTLAEGAVRFERQPDGTVKQVAAGSQKPRAPIQVDTGTHIEFRDAVDPTKLLQRIPKSQMPTAGQVVETANGPMIVNTRTGDAQPIMAGGQPLAPKLSSEQSKDITAINQQRATIEGAIADVTKNKSAFSFGRGIAQNAPYGESIAGRFEKPEDTQARAYVFNNVSAVIKERAGTAQSAQELSRLNSFLPATTDNADQIIAKLNGFKQYLNDFEKGTRVPTSKQQNKDQLSTQDQEALNWANSNPNDPRSKQIKLRLNQ
jgi:hypothetical protein